MAYQESAYQNLLFGVSQQASKDRLPGQLAAQVNMTSDLVAGLRRRAPVQFVQDLGSYTDYTRIKQYNTDVGGRSVSVTVDTTSGQLNVVDELTGSLLLSTASAYFITASASLIRMVTLADQVFVCNVAWKPTLQNAPDKAGYPDPDRWGWFYVPAGAFSKRYDVTVTDRTSGHSYTATYTTPNGTEPTHVARATPEYIANQLRSDIEANLAGFGTGAVSYISGAYVTFRGNASSGITISSPSGTPYIRASNAMSVKDIDDLPALLPIAADGLITAVGIGKEKTFYRYDHARRVWTEDCAWDDMQRPNQVNMPRVLKYDAGLGTWGLGYAGWERRAAGNAESNPNFKFLADGITGMCAFQGRLVFLSNEYVCMSASNNPVRFYRSTLATLADNDPIEIAAQGQLTAPYEYGVTFNKDLILFGRRYQGVVPGSIGITPRTANISLMTKYEVDTTAMPVVAGRSVFFGAPRSLGYYGIHEMVPSQYTDAQYVADDVTAHVPQYMLGPWRFIVASSTTNIMVAGLVGEPHTLVVHQYLWEGAEKVHHAWHKWTFAYPVIDAYFSGDVLIGLFAINGRVVMCRLDLQRGAQDSAKTARLDFFVEATCSVAGKLTVPGTLSNIGELHAFKTFGDDAYLGQKVLSKTVVGSNTELDLLDAQPGDKFVVGIKYTSVAVPTPPVIKDAKGVPITTSRAVIHRWRVSVKDTGMFVYTVSDAVRAVPPVETTPLRLFSPSLGAGVPLVDTDTVTIPGRVDMLSATLKLETADYYDLNIQSIEYGFRFTQRFRRA